MTTVLVSALSVNAQAASGATAPSLPPVSYCVGQRFDVCISVLKSVFNIKEDELKQSFARLDEKDVIGNSTNPRRSVIFDGSSKAFENPITKKSIIVSFDLSLTPENRVENISLMAEVNVWGMNEARTEDQYNNSNLRMMMYALFSPACWNGSDLAMFKWFESNVRPKYGDYAEQNHVDMGGASQTHSSEADDIGLCNTKLKFSTDSGYNTDLISDTNSSGVFRNEFLFVENDGVQAPALKDQSQSTNQTNSAPSAGIAAGQRTIGIRYAPSPVGAVVMSVDPGSKAEAAGLKPGETIEAVDGKSTKGLDAVAVAAMLHSPIPILTLTVVGIGDIKIRW